MYVCQRGRGESGRETDGVTEGEAKVKKANANNASCGKEERERERVKERGG